MNRRMWGEERRKAPVVVGVDVGSVAVRVVVTAVEEGPRPATAAIAARAVPAPRTLRVLGIGEAPTQGMRRGGVVNPTLLGESLHEAVREAQAAAGHRILRASLAVPLTLFETIQGGARVTLPDLASVRAVLRPSRSYADAWDAVAAAAGIEWVGVLPSAIAAAMATLLPEEQEAGVALVECGAEQTSVAICTDAGVQRVVCLPVGGDHITRDLAALLGVRPAEAERLKLVVGNIRTVAHTEVPACGADGKRKSVAVALIVAIVAARVEQIMGRVAEVIRPTLHPVLHPASGREFGAERAAAVESVVLCGGGAALSGVAHVARAALGVPVRVAGPWGVVGAPEAQTPGYAVTLGMVRWWDMVQAGQTPGVGRVREREERTGAAHEMHKATHNRWQSWLREFLP